MTATPSMTTTELVPLHLDYATAVDGSVPDGIITFDAERQVSLFDGVPFSEIDAGARMQVTSSDVISDGKKGVVDTNQPDDATPNA